MTMSTAYVLGPQCWSLLCSCIFLPLPYPKESSFPQHCSPPPISLGFAWGGLQGDVFRHLGLPPTLKPHPHHPPEHHGRSLLCLETMGPQGNCRLFVRRVRRISTRSGSHVKVTDAEDRGESSEGEAELRGRRKGSGSWVVSDEKRQEHKTRRWACRPCNPRGQIRFRPACIRLNLAANGYQLRRWSGSPGLTTADCPAAGNAPMESRTLPCLSSLEIGAPVGTACALLTQGGAWAVTCWWFRSELGSATHRVVYGATLPCVQAAGAIEGGIAVAVTSEYAGTGCHDGADSPFR